MIVEISGKNYEKCLESSKNMWCSSKKGQYGHGLINTPCDPTKVERIGRLGEMALSLVTGLQPDFGYIKNGDASDFIGTKIDMKTASKYPRYETGLIQAINERGVKLPLKNDIYVFGYVIKDDITNHLANIEIVGWQTKEFIEKLPIVIARMGSHQNYEVPYKNLLPIEGLTQKL